MLIGLGGVSALAAMLEASALVALVPFARSIATRERAFEAQVGGHAIRMTIPQLAMVCALLIVARAATQMLAGYMQASIVSAYEARRRTELFSAFLKASWDCQARERSGQLLDLLNTFVPYSRQALDALCGSLVAVFSLLMLTCAALLVDPGAAVSLLVAVAVLFFTMRPISRRAQRINSRQVRLDQAYATTVTEAVTLAREVRLLQASAAIEERTQLLVIESARNRRLQGFLSVLTSALYLNAALLMIVAGLGAVYAFGVNNISGLSAIVLLLIRGLSYSQTFQSLYHKFIEVGPYDETLHSRIQAFESEREVGDSLEQTIEEIDRLEFRSVRFEYNAGHPVLSDLTFGSCRGETIGIIGPSGAGKSTLVQLLLGLRRPASGDILINDRSLREVHSSVWLSCIGFVPQEPLLMNDTVATNIRFFREAMSDDDIADAAKAAYVHEEIMSWPDAYDTIVGERGTSISGGQRQRICIARALAGRPDVLVFDEPTSALDPRNEHLIQQTLRDLHGKTLVFIVAHRPATLAICDRIMVIEGGRLRQMGSREGMARRNLF